MIYLIFNEASTSMVKRTKKAKRSAFAGRTSMGIAKKQNDPLYSKYKRYNELRKDIKIKINRKYGPRARAYARKMI